MSSGSGWAKRVLQGQRNLPQKQTVIHDFYAGEITAEKRDLVPDLLSCPCPQGQDIRWHFFSTLCPLRHRGYEIIYKAGPYANSPSRGVR